MASVVKTAALHRELAYSLYNNDKATFCLAAFERLRV
jgi:hypothetical protein